MKKPKNSYSLTAKQRKDQRSPKDKNKAPEPVLENEIPESSEAAVLNKKFTKKSIILIVTAVTTGLVMILMAILIPLVIVPYAAYGKINNPVAKIYLSNKMVLEFEIYEKDSPYAATNFIYLARQKYFNGAIIFDIQNGFARFGGFTDSAFNHRENDQAFNKKIKDIPARENGKKFLYRLKAEPTQVVSNRYSTVGYLSFMRGISSTEFQISCSEQNNDRAQNLNGEQRQIEGTAFGQAINDDTRKNLAELAEIGERIDANGNKSGVQTMPGIQYWNLPVNTVKINKIKLYNLNRKKWNSKFNYEKYLTDSKYLERLEMPSGSLSFWSTGSSITT